MTAFFISTIVFLLVFLAVTLFALKHDGERLEELTEQVEELTDKLYDSEEQRNSLSRHYQSAVRGRIVKCTIDPVYGGYALYVTKSNGFCNTAVKLKEFISDDNDYARLCAEELKEMLENNTTTT